MDRSCPWHQTGQSICTLQSLYCKSFERLPHQKTWPRCVSATIFMHLCSRANQSIDKALMPMGSRDSLAQVSENDVLEDLDPATASMIRRRSLAQPGVATRFSLGKSDRAVLRKAVPAPCVQPSQSWTKDMMGASPLARLSSIDLMEPPQQNFENRAHTPSELEYSQLGNLKHGSLQVVNGCPSPVPSMASPGRTDRKVSDGQDENYFTASERGDDSRPTSQQTPTLSQSTWNAPHAMEVQLRGRGRVHDYTPQPREASLLKQEVRMSSLEATQDADAESVYSRQLRPSPSMASLPSHSGRRFSFEETPEPTLPVVPLRLPEGSQSANNLANDYMAEMPPSPHKKVEREVEPASLPRLEDVVPRPMSAVRKPVQTPAAPHLEEVVRPPMSSLSDIREQIVVMPPSIAQDPPAISPRRPLDSHPAPDRPPPDLPVIPAQKPRRPVGVKVDSGYSSNASARNSTSETASPVDARANLATVGYLTPAMPNQPKQARRVYSSNGMAELSVRIGQIGGRSSEPPSAIEPTIEEDIVESIEKDPMPEEKVNRRKSWRKSVRRSLPRLMSADSATSVFSKSTSAISDTTTSSERQPKKLQKKRPFSQPPINMADRHVLAQGGVPRVPSTVFSRHSNRLSMTPGMEHLEQTYDSGIESRESSFDPVTATVANKPSLPSCFFPDADIEGPPEPPARRRMSFGRQSFRRSRSRSKPRMEDSEVLSNGIADFGTVGQSLGTSPYDAAMPPMPRRVSAGTNTQPHHLSTMASWSGPREGWDDQTAARIAQTRSRERASQMYAEQQQRDAEIGYRAERTRPISYHKDMPVLKVFRPATGPPLPRPKSMHGSAPISEPPNSWYDDRDSAPQSRAASRPRTPHASSRDPSPVKKLVNVFEQRATDNGPPPMPLQHTQPDWTDSSRMWRERRQHAAQTASPPRPVQQQQRRPAPPSHTQTMSVTTTTVTNLGGTNSRTTAGAQRPPLQMNRKSMPQMRTVHTGPTSSYTTTTTTSYGGNRGSYVHTSSAGAGAGREFPPTTTTTRRFYQGMDFGDVPLRVI